MADRDFLVKNGLQVASSNIVANSSGLYIANTTGVINAASHTVGTSFTANSSVVNAVAYNISTSFIANTTGAYHTGTINAASHTVGTSVIANTSGVYTTGTVNATTVSTGTLFTANSSLVNAYALTLQTNTATIGTAAYFVSNGNFGISNNAPADKLSVNGTGYFNGNVTSLGVISSSSDERLKSDIKIIENPLEKINAINGITFKFINTDVISTGLIAQEVEKVLPEAVSINENGMKFVAYGNIVGLLVESIKELRKEIEEIKNGSIH
jgi:hypothetical protein